ncbi:sensor histidine kinase [Dictyobacter arantiisoli]|uniref:histidine kinase n=1 Tax=Dictyobacter arantiisoli TaxID=2014874 RepID=A0A5A5TC62_9CHLR|nr:HAMP domain-containing sensor histidine kinase [Dictyobacter arantiisoli]GCF08736.1 hypothetical protein KDI_23000 [Dictyobacter arantiisoli]
MRQFLRYMSPLPWVSGWRMPFVRACFDLLALQMLLVIVFTGKNVTVHVPGLNTINEFPRFFLFIYCLISCVFFAFRWQARPASRTFWQQLLIEIEVAGFLFFELAGSLYLFFFLFQYNQLQFLLAQPDLWHTAAFSFLPLSSICFFCLRATLYLLSVWNRLRATRLRWEVTHSHLMTVVIGAGAISFLFVCLQVGWGVVNVMNNTSVLMRIVGFLLIMFVVTAIAMACVLPPSILSSYIFTRRFTRRIERLAAATSILRNGGYSIRVSVEGQDEIAHLQADFNAMAAELERTMRELKEERDNVATLLHARRELIASVSHELRTPVATVRSYLESTLANWPDDQPPATLKQDMSIVEQQTIRLQSLINDLFTLSRAEVGHLEMRCEPTNVDVLVQRVVDMSSPLAWRGSRVEVLAEIAACKPAFPRALIDHQRLEQILHNLIHNGIRHTPPGGIVAISAYADERSIILQVKDTGEGIAAAELAKIWDRFYRASNAQSQYGTGTGLGLAIVKELTEAMGGTVAVESKVGQGSCFTICLPRVLPDSITAPTQIIQHA